MELYEKIQAGWKNIKLAMICDNIKDALKKEKITLKDISAISTMFNNGMNFNDIEKKMNVYQKLHTDIPNLRNTYRLLVEEYEEKKNQLDKEMADRIRSVESLEKYKEKELKEKENEFINKLNTVEKSWASNINKINKFLDVDGIIYGFNPNDEIWFEDENGKPTSSIVKTKRKELIDFLEDGKFTSKLTVSYIVNYNNTETILNHNEVYGSIDELLSTIKQNLM